MKECANELYHEEGLRLGCMLKQWIIQLKVYIN